MKLVREHIFEKFTEDSDPIFDLGIGMRHLIEKWLNQYDIKDYHINDDFTIDVNRRVDLRERNLTKLPEYIQFNIVQEYFDACKNNFITMKGFPKIIKNDGKSAFWGNFWCNDNKLTSLRYSPKIVEGRCAIHDNAKQFAREDIRKICEVGHDIVV